MESVFVLRSISVCVAVNHGYDTCFGNDGLYADCKLKHQSSFNHKLGPLSDTLQAGA